MTHRQARGPRTRIFSSLSLGGRFALLSALAVSVAIIVAALASYFLVSDQLNNQVNENFATRANEISNTLSSRALELNETLTSSSQRN